MHWNSVTQVKGSNFTNTTTAYLDITGLTFPADANTKYEVEVVLTGQSSTTLGVKFDINASGATGTWCGFGNSTSTGAQVYGTTIGTPPSASHWTTANTDLTLFAKGIIITTTAANITVRVSKNTSGTATVYIGSVFKVRKL